jgi:hypothetical protein
MALVHDLKTWPVYFEQQLAGLKPFELRLDDRGYRVGDILWLREWDPRTQAYTGRELRVEVTFLLRGSEHLAPGYVAMGTCRMPTATPADEPALEAQGAQG